MLLVMNKGILIGGVIGIIIGFFINLFSILSMVNFALSSIDIFLLIVSALLRPILLGIGGGVIGHTFYKLIKMPKSLTLDAQDEKK